MQHTLLRNGEEAERNKNTQTKTQDHTSELEIQAPNSKWQDASIKTVKNNEDNVYLLEFWILQQTCSSCKRPGNILYANDRGS